MVYYLRAEDDETNYRLSLIDKDGKTIYVRSTSFNFLHLQSWFPECFNFVCMTLDQVKLLNNLYETDFETIPEPRMKKYALQYYKTGVNPFP